MSTPSPSRPRVLVVTTVHPPDDPRIRYKTAASLAKDVAVRLATRAPGPSDTRGIDPVVLEGSRPRRAVAALREMLRRDVDLVSIHDPELLPVALLARLVRRVPVVFDVHEDLPVRAGLSRRVTEPPTGGRAAATAVRARVGPWLARRLLHLVERVVVVTLAEEGYARDFRRAHPVLPNHLLVDVLPSPTSSTTEGGVVYLGDVTTARGVIVLLDAVASGLPGRPLHLIGRCAPDLADTLRRRADELGVALELHGWMPLPEALRRVAVCEVAACPLTDHPAYRWSLPTKVLEYLAVGVPVVASDLPGTAEVVGELPGVVLVAPDHVDELARGLATATDPALRAAAARGADAVRERFGWPDERIRQVYRDVLSASPGP